MSGYAKPYPKSEPIPKKVKAPLRRVYELKGFKAFAKAFAAPIRKVSLTNTSLCSNGERVTNVEIKKRLTAAYRLFDANNPSNYCQGCGAPRNGHAHILPKAVCKHLGKTELIWDINNLFWACSDCNTIAENPASEAITRLLNYQQIKEYLQEHDPSRATKLNK
jgi:hypothetical protein